MRAWFSSSFPAPTEAQAQGWPAIAEGDHTLILAPTGSGKTLAAFLWGLDRLMTQPVPDRTRRTRLIYLSPLRALAVDVEKNLRAPLAGVRLAAERLGTPLHEPTVGMRTGDTDPDDRRRLVRHPPDLLITTPESLYLMLTSAARETLAGVEAVIVDEIHAVAATKRGAHLALTLERLDAICDRPPQRIGLSATQRPLEEIARFLGGFGADRKPRPVTVVDAGTRKPMEIEVIVPVEDMGELGQVIEEPVSGPASAGPVRRSIWPAMHPRLLELVKAHRSTLVFVNARRLAERLATRLNELAVAEAAEDGNGNGALGHGNGPLSRGAEAEGRPPGPDELDGRELVRAHHGSLSRERRLLIEDDLKSGRLKGLVATSSLELGIDMGAVDLVVQVESPGAVSRGLQRIGRAGHSVGEPSRGKLFPKHRGDLLEAAVVVERMHEGLIERTRYPRNPLDVLAQQIVAACALDDWKVDDLAELVRRAANFADLTDDVFTSVLDLLAGRYPSEEFAELRPRIVWDRVDGVVRGRAGAQRLAVTSGGTIPDRGLYGVFLPDGKRVGELDEEMVYESRTGETFLLGASTWRIEDITHERVVVTPAPGQPGKMPFWRGDGPGRPLELGQALGAFVREVRALPHGQALDRLRTRHSLDERAATNLLAYLQEQAEATGVVPDDRTVVVERFRDEIGDWRVCVLSCFGAQVHAPWGMALQARLAERWGVDVELLWSDDGIVLRLPEAIEELPLEELSIDPEEIDELVVGQLPSTALFAARFRECAARALLLPRRRPDRRTPLWQQRQKAADLLAVAGRHPTFPILLETTRECLNDVFDLPALREVLRDLRSRKVRLVPVDTPQASPFAQGLLFGWIAVYMYEGDAPLAERRAAALALDRDLLRELLGAEELRELLDPGVLADVELDLQRLSDGRRARSADELHDVLRRVGDLTVAELDLRTEDPASVLRLPVGAEDGDRQQGWLAELLSEKRAIEVVVAGETRYAAADDAARYRDALGCALPLGLPVAFTDPVPRPLEDLIGRYGRTHGPFTEREVAVRLGIPETRVLGALSALEHTDRVVRGEFRPDGVRREWCDVEVLRQLRRRSLATLRREVEPVEPAALARFLPAWHGIPPQRRGVEAVVEALGLLAGAPIVASTLESDVLAARVSDYRSALLDELCTSGDVVWVGAGAIGSSDGRVRVAFADQLALLAPGWEIQPRPEGPLHDAIRLVLGDRGASFWGQLRAATPGTTDNEVLAALWDLVWSGEVTNDSLAPLRAVTGTAGARAPKRGGGDRRGQRPRPGRLNRVGPPSGAGRWSLVAPLLEPVPIPTEAAHATALQLVERQGIVTREGVLAEGVVGGYASVYGVLKVLEERGQVRRGYFVNGLGAAQFALPGAVDRLRMARERADDAIGTDGAVAAPVVLAATDPAQPYGATLAWPDSPGRPARIGAAVVVLRDGMPIAWYDRRSHHLVTFPDTHDDPSWAEALADLVRAGRLRRVEVRKVDGEPIATSAANSEITLAAKAAGWTDGYKGLQFTSR